MGRGRAARQSVLVAAAKGDDREAAAAFMSYWLGRWRWSPERFKSAIAATIPKVTLGIITNAPTTLKVCAEVTAPMLLIKGSKTPRAPTLWSIFWERHFQMPRSRR
ncbi:MAG: hypothetical protein WA717_04180 [Methyloceanibacter sp.]